MRLIDADALLLELELLYDETDAKYHETDFDSFYGGGCSMVQEVIKGVEKQPTAFDVDKVVEKLNNIKKYNLNLADIMLDIQANGTNRHFICLEDAIEIVKAGVKNENKQE